MLPVALHSLIHLKMLCCSGTGSWRSSLLHRSSCCVSLMEPVRMNASAATVRVWTGQCSMANWLRAFQLPMHAWFLRTWSPTGLPTEIGRYNMCHHVQQYVLPFKLFFWWVLTWPPFYKLCFCYCSPLILPPRWAISCFRNGNNIGGLILNWFRKLSCIILGFLIYFDHFLM
jgi:hypothetical protein